MRRKGSNRGVLVIGGQVERNLIGAVIFIALLLWGVHSGQSVTVEPMPKDRAIADLGMLPDPDHDALRVSIARLEVR